MSDSPISKGSQFGQLFKISTFGESHGPGIGVIIDGCPTGLELNESDIQVELDRRRPGQSSVTTPRKESDTVEILSGTFEGKTTGTPISLIIYNEDQKSRDYETIKTKFRPGHADYTYFMKYGIRDYKGGGRQSARETAARVAAGAIAKKVLDAGRIIFAADSLGASETMIEKAVSYAKERKQFNRVIGSFQAVKHMCAEMASDLEPCYAMLWQAAHSFDHEPDEARLQACQAKSHISEVAKMVSKKATEVHGGMGFTDLLGLHYWFKRIGLNRQLLGGPELIREEAAEIQGFNQ